jgi:hypothetical protein
VIGPRPGEALAGIPPELDPPAAAATTGRSHDAATAASVVMSRFFSHIDSLLCVGPPT